MPEIGKARARYEPNIAGTNNCNAHGTIISLSLARRGTRIGSISRTRIALFAISLSSAPWCQCRHCLLGKKPVKITDCFYQSYSQLGLRFPSQNFPGLGNVRLALP